LSIAFNLALDVRHVFSLIQVKVLSSEAQRQSVNSSADNRFRLATRLPDAAAVNDFLNAEDGAENHN
tara:strand:- start:367 stop:567 length:201 start_codon:yes stop_codon:yes gene_type:complete